MSGGVIVRWRGVFLNNRPGAQVANSCKNSTCASSATSTSNEPGRRTTALQSRPWWRKTNNINELFCLPEGLRMQFYFVNGRGLHLIFTGRMTLWPGNRHVLKLNCFASLSSHLPVSVVAVTQQQLTEWELQSTSWIIYVKMELNFARRAVLKPDIFLVTFSAGKQRVFLTGLFRMNGRLCVPF